MNSFIKKTSLSTLAFFTLSIFTQIYAEQISEQNSPIASYIHSQKTEDELKIKDLLSKLTKELDENNFNECESILTKCEKLVDGLGYSEHVESIKSEISSERVKVYSKWSDVLEKEAEEAYAKGEWEKSITLSKESLDKLKVVELNGNINSSADRSENIKKSLNALKSDNFTKVTAIDSSSPDLKYLNYEVSLLFTRSETYYNHREFAKARDLLEQILVMEPYNYKAMYMLKSVYSELYKTAMGRSKAEQIEAISAVTWTNNQPISPQISNVTTTVIDESKELKVDELKMKIQEIIIPKLDFDNANISSVITYISEQSKIYDKDAGKGINIVLRLDRASSEDTKKITMNLDDIPIGEAIKYLCLAAGLTYRVEENAVIIGNNGGETVITEFFPIKSGLINSIISNINISNESLIDNQNKTKSSEFGKKINTNAKTINSTELETYFRQRGIPFPTGASVAWDSKTSMIIMTNTSENIRNMDALLREIDIDIPLVLIETKFIEITETELEELSFRWQLAAQTKASGSDVYINPFNPATPGGTDYQGNDALMRYVGGADPIGALVNELSKTASSGLTNFKFWAYALDRSETAEILSSPKVITKSGSKAEIRMVKEEYFPETWSNPEIETSSSTSDVSSISTVYTSPEFGDPTDLGIKLQVTPIVSPNNYTIYLELHPEVIDLVGWDYYSFFITDDVDTGVASEQTVKMPIISYRDVVTKVKVYDGETVVLGGMITEDMEKVDDIYPVIGDMPLIGRLFASKYENAVKKNLLIFVTARLIKSDGSPMRQSENKLFDFNR